MLYRSEYWVMNKNKKNEILMRMRVTEMRITICGG